MVKEILEAYGGGPPQNEICAFIDHDDNFEEVGGVELRNMHIFIFFLLIILRVNVFYLQRCKET